MGMRRFSRDRGDLFFPEARGQVIEGEAPPPGSLSTPGVIDPSRLSTLTGGSLAPVKKGERGTPGYEPFGSPALTNGHAHKVQ